MAKGQFEFEEGARVLAYHGPQIYEAKVVRNEMRIDPSEPDGENIAMYFTHYSGWNKSWDEWLVVDRLMAYNEEGLALQHKLKTSRSKKDKMRAKRMSDGRLVSTRKDFDADHANKRRRGERGSLPTDNTEHADIVLPIPDKLKLRLIDDWNFITRQSKLVGLPRTPSISSILDGYCDHVKGQGLVATTLAYEITCGIKVYFENALGPVLLYRQERLQYAEQREAFPEGELANVYGAEHLLRLFVKLPMLLSHAKIAERGVAHLVVGLNDILRYISSREDELFKPEQCYVEHSEDYGKRRDKV